MTFRCLKEIQMYEKEAEKHQERIATMEASNACPHDIKKQVCVPGRVLE